MAAANVLRSPKHFERSIEYLSRRLMNISTNLFGSPADSDASAASPSRRTAAAMRLMRRGSPSGKRMNNSNIRRKSGGGGGMRRQRGQRGG